MKPERLQESKINLWVFIFWKIISQMFPTLCTIVTDSESLPLQCQLLSKSFHKHVILPSQYSWEGWGGFNYPFGGWGEWGPQILRTTKTQGHLLALILFTVPCCQCLTPCLFPNLESIESVFQELLLFFGTVNIFLLIFFTSQITSTTFAQYWREK